MSSDFFIAKENSERYDTVCDIRKKKDRKNSNVLTAFSGLECPDQQLHEWESHKPLYIKKFKKAKQCMQRRITKMKEFSGSNPKNRTERRKHIYPIQVAYAYGKDCLKKIASKDNQTLFQTSVDELIDKVSERQPDIKRTFGESIEDSIKSRSISDPVRKILEKTYYNTNQQDTINKERMIGYNALNEEDKEKFYSIYNEGFSKNARYANLKNEEEEKEEEEEAAVNENLAVLKPSKTIKRNFRRRRATKKKPKSIAPPLNLNKLNEILASNKFKITNANILSSIKLKIKELAKLYVEKVYIDEKMFMLEDIFFGSSEKPNQINVNVYGALSKTSGLRPSAKSVKKAGITANIVPKVKAADIRQKLYKDMSDTHQHLKSRLEETVKKINNLLLKSEPETAKALQDFYFYDIASYIKNEVNEEISKIPSDRLIELLKEKNYLYSLTTTVKDINQELLSVELALNKNLQDQAKIETKLKNTSDKKLLANTRILFEDKLKTLKENQKLLEKDILDKYIEKTDKLRVLVQEISKTYENPLILKDKVEILDVALKMKLNTTSLLSLLK
jgi:hypothetical protein